MSLSVVGWVLLLSCCMGLIGVSGQVYNCPAGCHEKCECAQTTRENRTIVICEDLESKFFDCLNPDVIEFQLRRSALRTLSASDLHAGENLENLDISHNENFTVIERDAMTGLTKLKHVYLEHNRFGTLTESIFPTTIEELRLSHNRLTDVRYDVVIGGLRASLTQLSLSHNDLREFACPPLDALVALELHGNLIGSLRDETFHDCPQIENVDLSSNLIKEVTLNWTVAPRIAFLDLSFNEIDAIGKEFHTALTRLEYLRLTRNVLREVPPLPHRLKALDLNGNNFGIIRRDAFKNLTRLSYLELSDMPHLLEIEVGAFSGLVSLFSIWMQSNRELTFIPADAWPDSPELVELHLSTNNIMIFRRELFEDLDDLWIVDIAGNPIHCSCENAWMRVEMDSWENRWIRPWINGSEAVVCRSPENLAGFRVSELYPVDLTCDPPVVERNSMTKIANGIVLEAVLSKGVPSTSWYLPDGRHIVAHREKIIDASASEALPLIEEHVLENFTVIARLTAFTSNHPPYDLEPGRYILKCENAGGFTNFTFDVGPQTAGPPPSSGGGPSGGMVAGVVIVTLILAVLLSVGGYFGYRYVTARRRNRYEDVDDEPEVTSSSSSTHVQEIPESGVSAFRGGSTGYGSTG